MFIHKLVRVTPLNEHEYHFYGIKKKSQWIMVEIGTGVDKSFDSVRLGRLVDWCLRGTVLTLILIQKGVDNAPY